MTDYDYSQHRVELSSSNSGANDATALSGYHLDVRPDRNWPGTHANPNSQRLNTDKMLEIAASIDDLVSTLQGSGASQIASAANVSFGPDVWAAAVYLRDASQQVGTGVSQYTQKLVQSLQSASAAIKASAHGYSGAEHANTRSATNQQSSLDQTTSSGF